MRQTRSKLVTFLSGTERMRKVHMLVKRMDRRLMRVRRKKRDIELIL